MKIKNLSINLTKTIPDQINGGTDAQLGDKKKEPSKRKTWGMLKHFLPFGAVSLGVPDNDERD